MRHVFIDGNYYASRCRHAGAANLSRSDGTQSGVLFGLLKSVSFTRYEMALGRENITVFFDQGLASWRSMLFPGYKDRHKAWDDLTEEEQQELTAYREQLHEALEILPAAGYGCVRVPGCEADDLISLFVMWFVNSSPSNQAIICSSDKDFHQLSCQQIDLYDPQNKLQTYRDICGRWNVSDPKHITFLRALIGDDSDKIPGISGIGPVKAKRCAELAYLVEDANADLESYSKADRTLINKMRVDWAIVQRNLSLMVLPTAWDASGYSDQQIKEALQQFSDPSGRKRDLLKLTKFAEKWEFNSILENVDLW